MTEIPAVGVVPDLPAEDYHRHDSLSSSGARKLLSTCPAVFKYGEQKHSKAFDLGHAAHREVLGDGPDLVEVKAKDWRTKKAQEARDKAHAEGKVPLLTEQIQAVRAMAAKIRQHALAARLLDRPGRSELSIFWTDPETGAPLRCRPDFLADIWCVDYKTAIKADKRSVAKSVHEHGYFQQDPFYRDGISAAGLGELPFFFIFQEKTPPYEVAVYDVDDLSIAEGRARNRRAIDLYARCRETGEWPGYPMDVTTVSIPSYALRDLETA